MEYVLSFFGLPFGYKNQARAAVAGVFLHIRDHFVPHHRNNYQPHILGHRSLALMSGLLVVVKIFSVGLLSFGPVQPAFSSAITPENIIALTNASRVSFGLKQLTGNAALTKAAQAKADDMLQNGYFAHTAPSGKTPWDFISAAGYSYMSAGENLAVNFVEAEDVENAWMNSPGHKANILNKTFEEIGIGISQGIYQGKSAIFVVQMFGLAAEQKIVLDDKPTAVAPPVSAPAQNATPAEATLGQIKPQVLSAAPVVAETAVTASEPLAIAETSFTESGSFLTLTAKISGAPVKVLARFGKMAAMLAPKADGTWSGQINLTALAKEGQNIVLEAQDMSGAKISAPIATYAASTPANFGAVPDTSPNPGVSFLGRIIHPKNFEQQFYLVFMAAILSCLILAIAIKRHVQHLPLIANAAFVVILAAGLWMR